VEKPPAERSEAGDNLWKSPQPNEARLWITCGKTDGKRGNVLCPTGENLMEKMGKTFF